MSNAISVIYSQDVLGRNFKVYGTNEEPLFLAKDVAEWIDYSKDSKGNYRLYKLMELVDEDEKIKVKAVLGMGSSNGGVTSSKARHTQTAWFLTEDGLYEVLFQSRKPIAKQFQGA